MMTIGGGGGHPPLGLALPGDGCRCFRRLCNELPAILLRRLYSATRRTRPNRCYGREGEGVKVVGGRGGEGRGGGCEVQFLRFQAPMLF